MKDLRPRVVFVTPVLTHYRLRFHELIRSDLAQHNVQYEIIIGEPSKAEKAKGDLVEPDWVRKIPQRNIQALGVHLSFHPVLRAVKSADLIVLMQENKHVQNYLLQSIPKWMRPRLALMGHGRNFQSRNPRSAGEKWKRFWATKAEWWFGYTEESRAHVSSLGFPDDRITVFNNSVDTTGMRAQVSASLPAARAALAASMGLKSKHVGVFVGGIYPDKRIDFLVNACDRIRAQIPDFELIIVGGGPDLPVVKQLAEGRPWIHVMGPRFGQEKVDLMMLGQVFMMPGLMGLAILDAGTARLAIATTAFPWHSPEIAYLEPGISGIKVADWESPEAYAYEVAALLQSPLKLEQMREAARAMADRYSIEAMARNFANGILKALVA